MGFRGNYLLSLQKSADGLWTTAHDGWLITEEQSERGGENRKHETATGVETTAEEVIDE